MHAGRGRGDSTHFGTGCPEDTALGGIWKLVTLVFWALSNQSSTLYANISQVLYPPMPNHATHPSGTNMTKVFAAPSTRMTPVLAALNTIKMRAPRPALHKAPHDTAPCTGPLTRCVSQGGQW